MLQQGTVTKQVGRGAGVALLMMFVVNASNFLDRMLFAILQEPIKHDLALTDFQLGLLGGPAFAILYSVVALPFGWLADRSSRVRMVSGIVALWSIMTAMCGFAGNFVTLLLARIGVSFGESGFAPAAHSLLADHFPPGRRAGAISIYTSGSSIGTLAAAFLGSALAHAYGWRMTFYICGAVGILLAVAVLLSLREPLRHDLTTEKTPTLGDAARALRGKRSFLHLCAGMSLATMCSYPIIQYLTSFLIRVHHFPLTSAARVTGVMIGGVGFLTTIMVGLVIDRGGKLFPRIGPLLPAIGLFLASLFYLASFLTASLPVLLSCLVLAVASGHGYIAAGFSVAQDLAPPRMRAMTSGLLLMVVGLFGYAFGSPILGAISDFVAGSALQGTGLTLHRCASMTANAVCASAQGKGLRWGLIGIDLPLMWAAAHFWLASRTFVADTARNPAST